LCHIESGVYLFSLRILAAKWGHIMFSYRLAVLVCALLVGKPCLADNIIDHTDLAGVPSLPQSTMDAIGQQKWLFTHASVGYNMVSGLNTLHATSPSFYQLTVSSVTYDSANLRAGAPGTTTPGTVYECERGNPGASTKFAIFDNSVRLSGWHDSAASIVMDKLCYIDQDANVSTYLNTMSSLESAYPTTVFVYTTMPLMTAGDSDNVLRDTYNANVRAYCLTNNKYLFDIADIEAWDPSDSRQSFSANGQTYDQLYSGYSSDGGHLNAVGESRVATGWYAMAAQIANPVPEPSTALLLVPTALLLLRGRGIRSKRKPA
jgi:hypothetical protein